jgi:hypothetical protein
MGQAKARKSIIDQLKAAGANMKLESFGAFYNATSDNGFSVTFDRDMLPIDDLSKEIKQGADNYLKAVTDKFTLADMIADVIKQTEEELIPYINTKLYGTPTQPTEGRRMVDIKPALGEILMFAMNVQFLQDRGAIKCDDDNGMLFISKSK